MGEQFNVVLATLLICFHLSSAVVCPIGLTTTAEETPNHLFLDDMALSQNGLSHNGCSIKQDQTWRSMNFMSSPSMSASVNYNDRRKSKDWHYKAQNTRRDETIRHLSSTDKRVSGEITANHENYETTDKTVARCTPAATISISWCDQVTLQRAHLAHGQAANGANAKCEAGEHMWINRIKRRLKPIHTEYFHSSGATTLSFVIKKGQRRRLLRPALNHLSAHGRAAWQHNMSAQLLADVSVAFHGLRWLLLPVKRGWENTSAQRKRSVPVEFERISSWK